MSLHIISGIDAITGKNSSILLASESLAIVLSIPIMPEGLNQVFSNLELTNFKGKKFDQLCCEPNQAITALSSLDCSFIPLPLAGRRDRDSNWKGGMAYINPKAFQFANVTAPEVFDGETEETVQAYMGIRGCGRFQTRVNSGVLDKFISDVSTVKTGLLRVQFETATAGMHYQSHYKEKPDYVILDADEIDSMEVRKTDAAIHFCDGQKTGWVHFSLPDEHSYFGKDENEIKRRTKLLEQFCDSVSDKTAGLLKFENAINPTFVRSGCIEGVYQEGRRITVTLGSYHFVQSNYEDTKTAEKSLIQLHSDLSPM